MSGIVSLAPSFLVIRLVTTIGGLIGSFQPCPSFPLAGGVACHISSRPLSYGCRVALKSGPGIYRGICSGAVNEIG